MTHTPAQRKKLALLSQAAWAKAADMRKRGDHGDHGFGVGHCFHESGAPSCVMGHVAHTAGYRSKGQKSGAVRTLADFLQVNPGGSIVDAANEVERVNDRQSRAMPLAFALENFAVAIDKVLKPED